MDANEPNVLNNYAVFLSECRNDTAAAEKMSVFPIRQSRPDSNKTVKA